MVTAIERLYFRIVGVGIVFFFFQNALLHEANRRIAASHQGEEKASPYDFEHSTMPYEGVSWNKLPPIAKRAAKDLGYSTSDMWEQGGETSIFARNWEELSPMQRKSATILGYTREKWLGTPELVHIVNFYYPLDDTQKLVMESMRKAKEQFHYCSNRDNLRLKVKLMAAVHPKHAGVVPTYFDSVILVKQLYNDRFPLFQELLEFPLTGNKHTSHLIYTNADIVVHPNFYCKVKDLIQVRKYDGFATNRITIPRNTTSKEFFETTMQNRHFHTEKKHPGHDCFVFSKEVAEKMNFGKSFIGTTAFANEIMIQMYHFAKESKRFESFDEPYTYHRGDDRNWLNKDFLVHLKKGVVSAACGKPNRYHEYCRPNMPASPKRNFCNRLPSKAQNLWKTTYKPFTLSNVTKWCSEVEREFEIQIGTTSWRKERSKEERSGHSSQTLLFNRSNDVNEIVFYPWVENYIQYYKSSIENGRLREGVPYIVYQCKNGDTKCGGAGDRLMAMTKMFYLAMCTKRILLIDATFPIPLNAVLNPAHLQWNASFPDTDVVFNDLDEEVPLTPRNGILGYRISSTNGFPRKKTLQQILNSQVCKRHFEGKFNDHIADAVNQAFWALFKFDSAVAKRAEELTVLAGINGPYVGLHARTGDGKMVTKRKGKIFRRATDENKLLKCYHKFQTVYPKEFNGAYIASDNQDFKTDMNIKDSSIHYVKDFRAFHIDLQVRNATDDGVGIYQGTMDTWAEILVLANSLCLVMSESMFSFAAQYIRGPKTCNVFLPRCDERNEVTKAYNMYYGDNVINKKYNTSDFVVHVE